MSNPDQENPQPLARPVLRVVRGEPTPEELAALLTVLATRTTAPPATAGGTGFRGAATGSGWRDPAAGHRHPQFPGERAWRASSLPR